MRAVITNMLPEVWTPWSNLRRFREEQFVTRAIMERHSLGERQRPNAQKQARQIGYCLSQAEEYWRAFKSASLATSPLQLYYCTMSLALAETLWRGTGDVSLDRVRQSDGHHGLEFSWQKKTLELQDLPHLTAVPHMRSKRRSGTFAVWHRHTREGGIVGKKFIKLDKHDVNMTVTEVIFRPAEEPMPELPADGMNLLDIYASIPQMNHALRSLGMTSKIVRTTVSSAQLDSNLDGLDELHATTVVVHPTSEVLMHEFESQIKFTASSIEDLKIEKIGRGTKLIHWHYACKQGATGSMGLPDPVSIGVASTYFKPHTPWLNEFGLYYVACFLLGMLCRYYPELWMAQITKNSGFAYLAETVTSVASQRLPLITLGVLENAVYVENDSGELL